MCTPTKSECPIEPTVYLKNSHHISQHPPPPQWNPPLSTPTNPPTLSTRARVTSLSAQTPPLDAGSLVSRHERTLLPLTGLTRRAPGYAVGAAAARPQQSQPAVPKTGNLIACFKATMRSIKKPSGRVFLCLQSSPACCSPRGKSGPCKQALACVLLGHE